MLQERLQAFREAEKEILVCLGNAPQAQQEWLEAGGTAGHLLSPKQIESWLMTGGGALPREIAFSGTLSELVSLFPKTNAQEVEESKRRLNRMLSGVVVEYDDQNQNHDTDHWTYFTCQTVVMGCCMGEYLSIVNRKDI